LPLSSWHSQLPPKNPWTSRPGSRRRPGIEDAGLGLAPERLHLPGKPGIFSAMFSCPMDGLNLPGRLPQRRGCQVNCGGPDFRAITQSILRNNGNNIITAKIRVFRGALATEVKPEKPPPPNLI
jgi:hypothetical protein